MSLYEGERIKIFPDTNIDSYIRWIRSQGYLCHVDINEIVVDEKAFKTIDKVALGKLINQKRTKKKITIGEFADIIQATPRTVFHWEIGRMQPREYFIEQIRDVLEISQEELEQCRI